MNIPLRFRSYRYLSNKLTATNKTIKQIKGLIKNTIKGSEEDREQHYFLEELVLARRQKSELVEEINRRADRVAAIPILFGDEPIKVKWL